MATLWSSILHQHGLKSKRSCPDPLLVTWVRKKKHQQKLMLLACHLLALSFVTIFFQAWKMTHIWKPCKSVLTMDIIVLFYVTTDQVMEFPPYKTTTAGPVFSLTSFTNNCIVHNSARCNISDRRYFWKVTTLLWFHGNDEVLRGHWRWREQITSGSFYALYFFTNYSPG